MRRFLIVLVLVVLAVPAFGRHAWRKYHWSTTGYPMNIKVGDNVGSAWDSYLTEAISDWNQSSKLNLSKVSGGAGSNCTPTAGRIEVCNGAYGQNGWLGIAQIWLSGTNHIGQGTAKMNDTYYANAYYNTPGWRDLVMCQEVGHDFGLGHQDENNNNTNLGSCMDYTAYPDGGGTGGAKSNRAPNAHDYAQLDTIYNHVDGSNSYFSSYDVMTQSINRGGTQLPSFGDDFLQPWEWGTPVAWDDNGRAIRYERQISPNHDDGGDPNAMMVTDVFWAPFDPFERPETSRGSVNNN
jgi:hypothetical protein